MSMRLKFLFCLASMIAVASCGQASAKVADPANDLHCSALSFHFARVAKQAGAPADQQRAANAFHEWYAAKLRKVAEERRESASVFREMEPVLDAVERDHQSMLDEVTACAARAAADPAFEAFSRTFR